MVTNGNQWYQIVPNGTKLYLMLPKGTKHLMFLFPLTWQLRDKTKLTQSSKPKQFLHGLETYASSSTSYLLVQQPSVKWKLTILDKKFRNENEP